MVIKKYYQQNIPEQYFKAIENLISGYGIVGRMIKHIEDSGGLLITIKSIQQ